MFSIATLTQIEAKLSVSFSQEEIIAGISVMRTAMEILTLTTSPIHRATRPEHLGHCCSPMFNANTIRTMAKTKNKKLTIKYWCSLSRGSRERALKFCFPISPSIVEMLLDETPTTSEIKNGFWLVVFRRITIPQDHSFYKTCYMNETYLA